VLQQLFFGRTEETRQSLEELRTLLRMVTDRPADG
jgi:hypothetical protein